MSNYNVEDMASELVNKAKLEYRTRLLTAMGHKRQQMYTALNERALDLSLPIVSGDAVLALMDSMMEDVRNTFESLSDENVIK